MKHTLLLILDGLGLAPSSSQNAVSQANIPTIKRLLELPEMLPIEASGRFVGLPKGIIGNSETGHLNLGAGTVVYQSLTKIDIAIEDNSFYTNPVIHELLEKTKKNNGRVHFLGLLSNGGVHSHIDHIKALLKSAHAMNVQSYLHAFLDGRDTAPTSGLDFVKEILPRLEENGAKLASLCGRFYAMDRDKRWERIEEAYNLLTLGKGIKESDPLVALENAYKLKETDEFIKPRILDENGIIKENDSVFFFNFRPDRAKELSFALSSKNFDAFKREKIINLTEMATMTEYDSELELAVAFPKQNIQDTIGERISKQNLHQLRIAETEKYAHVTYFFNGGREEPFPLEDRILIPSPRDVATYDLKPEMSAYEVTEKLIEKMQEDTYSFIVCNIANPDMVGHTAVMPAALKALEVVDECVAKILEEVKKEDWKIIILADHGNIEHIADEKGTPDTAHTTNKVPLILIDGATPQKLDPNEFTKLGDIAKLIF